MGFLNYSYGEILKLTATDVHPPLYYWYLKTLVSLGELFTPGFGTVFWAKLGSLLPMAGLWLLSATLLRKQLGLLFSGSFIFCILSMPQLAAYSLEIRMYSFALLLVTLAFIFACRVFQSDTSGAYPGLLLTGILTAYTQYFSCMAIGILYLLLGFFLFGNKRSLKRWGWNIVISLLSFLPWLPILFRQLTSVNGGYWIPPLSWRSFPGAVKYIYLPLGGYPILNYLLAIIMILFTGLLFFLFLGKKKEKFSLKDPELFTVLAGFGMTAGVVIGGVTISLIFSPVFVYRYLIPTLGAFWFSFCYLLSKAPKKVLWLPALLFTVYVGYTNLKGFLWEENQKNLQMKTAMAAMESLAPDDVLLFNFNHPQAVMACYTSNPSYLLFQEAEPLIKTLYKDLGSISDVEEIKELLQEGRQVKFLGSFESREDLIKEWEQSGITSRFESSFLLERYWINLYSLSL